MAEQSDPDAQLALAEVCQLATRVLLKLDQSGLEWVAADRGTRAARRAGSGLALAESQRLVASVARRDGDHDRAQSITLGAVDHLTLTSRTPGPEHLVMATNLYCSAGYAAAKAGDRDRAADLLAEADATASRLTGHPGRHRAATANVVSHQVSAAYLLGDSGAALAHVHRQPLAAIPTTERRARLLVDTALAYDQHDDPGRAYRTLLAAERVAPGEVRTRSTAKRLIGTLLERPNQAGMPGLAAFAARAGVAA